MAQPTTSKFSEFMIHVESATTPGTYSFLCGFTSKSLDINNTTASTVVPDCASEDAPAYSEEEVVSQSVTFKGTGVFPREKAKEILEWALNGTSRSARVYTGKAIVGDIEYLQGLAILKTGGLQVARGERLQQALDFVFSTKPTVHLKA